MLFRSPFGLLVMRSGFLPRILGILLIFNCLAYVAASLTWLFAPEYANAVSNVALLPETGELWIALWMLIRGAGSAAARDRTATLGLAAQAQDAST